MALKIIGTSVSVAGCVGIYDILFRNEPDIRIHPKPQSYEGVPHDRWPSQRMIVEATSSNIINLPLQTRGITHRGLKEYHPAKGGFLGSGRWVLTSYASSSVFPSPPFKADLLYSNKTDPLFEFAPKQPFTHADELPYHFAADLLENPVETEVVYVDHWGVEKKKVMNWVENVTA